MTTKWLVILSVALLIIIAAVYAIAQPPSEPSRREMVEAANQINWNTIILALISLVGTVMTGVIAVFMAKVSNNTGKSVANSETTKVAAVETAKKVEAVRTDLEQARSVADEKMDGLAKVAHDTHVLVNNNMAVQLKLGMELSEFKATTTQRPEDIQAAKLARSMYEEHVKKQAIVDARPGGVPNA
jgi:hypothetical protein